MVGHGLVKKWASDPHGRIYHQPHCVEAAVDRHRSWLGAALRKNKKKEERVRKEEARLRDGYKVSGSAFSKAQKG